LPDSVLPRVGAPVSPREDANGLLPCRIRFTGTSNRTRRRLTVHEALASSSHGHRGVLLSHLGAGGGANAPELATHLAARIDAEPEFERLAEAPLNIVCFRWRPPGVPEDELEGLNTRLGEALLEDGRVFAGTTLFEGKVAFRPAIVNWQTREADVDFLVDVLSELGERLLEGEPATRA
jgi:hypothetical protein